MPSRAVTAVVKSVRTLLEIGTSAGLSDSQLLERYLLRHDDGAEAAFGALLERHGPMVLRVCRGVLHDEHDAEDAFQATFLILARKAGLIHKGGSIASWLFGVARRAAGRLKSQRTRRAIHEGQEGTVVQLEAWSSYRQPELIPEVQEEVDRLPERYRAPIVLCYIEGLTNEEAASQLRLPASTVRVRLMRARARLRDRLLSRGLAPAVLAGLAAGRAEGAIRASLVEETIKAAIHLAAGRAAGVSAQVAAVVEGVIRAMFFTKLKLCAVLLAALTIASAVMIPSLAAPAQPEQDQTGAKRATAAPAAAPAPKSTGGGPLVTVVTVGRSRWERTTTRPGTVIAAQSVDLYARISGYVSNLQVDIGSRVKRGDRLAEIFDPEIEVGVEKGRAEVERARARLVKAEAAIQVSEAAASADQAKVEVAKSTLDEAESTAKGQKKVLDRIQQMVKRGDVELRIADETADRYASARSAINTARSQVLVANAVLAEARARIAEALADVVEARSDLNIAESGLHSAVIVAAYARIDAPFDGIVTRRNFQVGDLVRSPNAGNVKPIVTVVRTQTMRVVVDVPEDDAPLLDEGDRAKVRIGGLGARAVYQGQIARTAYALDPVERTLRAEIDLPNTDGRLRPGESGIVTIVLAVKENVLTIPGSAIAVEDADGMTVCYRAVAGRAVRSRIRIGDRDDGTRFEVLEGLHEGDVIIAAPGAALVDGQEVQIQRDEGKPAGQ